MHILKVELLNPKAEKLLRNLAELKLIAIKEPNKNGFLKTLGRLRNKVVVPPSLEEITSEVDRVRSKRYGK